MCHVQRSIAYHLNTLLLLLMHLRLYTYVYGLADPEVGRGEKESRRA